MGRRRRKIVKRPVRPPPKVFLCPVCNAESVTVQVPEEGDEYAEVRCLACNTSGKVRWLPAYMPVDAYSKWYDMVMRGEISSSKSE